MGSSMKAVQIIEYNRPFYYGDCPLPDLGPKEALVRVKASGLCLTDLHLSQGRQRIEPLPRIPGHESAGEITALGAEVKGWKTGQRVLVVIDVPCQTCAHCLTGQTQRCRSLKRIGFERDGGHADYVAVPASNLISIPDHLN